MERGAEGPGERAVAGVCPVVGETHGPAVPDKGRRHRPARHCEPVHGRNRHQLPPKVSAIEVKSAMKIATAAATQMPEMIQNRMMTVVSGHPTSSK